MGKPKKRRPLRKVCENVNPDGVRRRSERVNKKIAASSMDVVDLVSDSSSEESEAEPSCSVQLSKSSRKHDGRTSTPRKRLKEKVDDCQSISLNKKRAVSHSNQKRRCNLKTSRKKETESLDSLSDDDWEPLMLRPNLSSRKHSPAGSPYTSLEAFTNQPFEETTDIFNRRMKEYSYYHSQSQIYDKETRTYLPFPKIDKILKKCNHYDFIDKNDPDLKVLRGDPPSRDEDSNTDTSTEEVLTPRDIYEKELHDYDYEIMTFEETYNSPETSLILRFRRERSYPDHDWLLHLRVDKDEHFAKILPKLAKKWNLKITELTMILFKPFFLDDAPITLNDTPRKRKIMPNHYIDCMRVDNPVSFNLSFSKSSYVVLNMINQSFCEKVVILQQEKKPMSIAMKEYSSMSGLNLKLLEFWYSDVKIDKKDTPLHLGMEKENDIVVCELDY